MVLTHSCGLLQVVDERSATLHLPREENVGQSCSHAELWQFEETEARTESVWLRIDASAEIKIPGKPITAGVPGEKTES